MKKKLIIILIFLLTFSFTFIGCDKPDKPEEPEDPLHGTWVHESGREITLNNGSFTEAIPSNGSLADFLRGTYTASGRSFSSSTTHVNGAVPNGIADIAGIKNEWYTIDAYIALIQGTDEKISIYKRIADIGIGLYTIKGNTLTILVIHEGGDYSTVYTKKP